MQLQVSRRSIIFFTFIATMFLPPYFSNVICDLIENIIVCFVVLDLLQNLYKPKFVICMSSFYWVFLVGMTLIYKYATVDIHLFTFYMKIVLCIIYIDYMMKYETANAINILFFVLIVYTLADFISIILFPEGLYYVERVYEWSTGYAPQWILGNKNNRTFWYLMLMLVSYVRYKVVKQKKSIVPIAISLISIAATLLLQSSTGFAAMVLASVGIFVVVVKENEIRFRVRYSWIYIVYFFLFVALLLGTTGFLSIIVEDLFNKDLTFTGRTIIWQASIIEFLKHPLFGVGIVDHTLAQSILGHQSFSDAHNAILHILWQGGIFLFLVTVLIFGFITIHVKRSYSANINFMCAMFICALLVESFFESVLSVQVTWYFLTVMYGIVPYCNNIHNNTIIDNKMKKAFNRKYCYEWE